MTHSFTLNHVAKHCDAVVSSVHKWENGDSMPGPQNIDNLASLYCVAIADLFTPNGASEKAYSIAATFENALEVVNRHLGDELRIVRRRK